MIRKNLPGILIILTTTLLLLGYLTKNRLNNYLSEGMQKSAGSEIILSGKDWVDSLFNYTKNGEDFNYTLLEFKSTGCTICKSMEPELEKVRHSGNKKINVVVLNIMNANSQNVMKYFGISAVPTQLLLDNEGNEFFRNYGFIAAEDLMGKL